MEEKKSRIEFYENRCCICYAVIIQKRGSKMRRTCSNACRQELYRLRKGIEEKPEDAPPPEKKKSLTPIYQRNRAKCPVCGTLITQPARGRKRITCSDRCRKALWRIEHPTCLICGKAFTPREEVRDLRYCSLECVREARNREDRFRRLQKRRKKYAMRPEWWPTAGSGYRTERIPWEGEEADAVLRERKPDCEYEEDQKKNPAMWTEEEWQAFEMGQIREVEEALGQPGRWTDRLAAGKGWDQPEEEDLMEEKPEIDWEKWLEEEKEAEKRRRLFKQLFGLAPFWWSLKMSESHAVFRNRRVTGNLSRNEGAGDYTRLQCTQRSPCALQHES